MTLTSSEVTIVTVCFFQMFIVEYVVHPVKDMLLCTFVPVGTCKCISCCGDVQCSPLHRVFSV